MTRQASSRAKSVLESAQQKVFHNNNMLTAKYYNKKTFDVVELKPDLMLKGS